MLPIQSDVQITSLKLVAEDTYSLCFLSPDITKSILPGQFVNIRVQNEYDPFLRRPYSISNVYGDECEILFAVVGKGTEILARKRIGDRIHILGPLGNSFGFEKDFQHALIVAGGIGMAPFPFLMKELQKKKKNVYVFIGARNKFRLIHDHYPNLSIATDDGSEGYHGNVVQCLEDYWNNHPLDDSFIFTCGPNIMLHAVQQFAKKNNIRCELSLESEMACGMGICQGCPIEQVGEERKYALVCTDGPCFDSNKILFSEHA